MDITVTLHEADGTVRAFNAYEVKREGAPLDVATVEQLCMKLRDMPTVTHRAIVSASSFTDGALAKAATHDVQLFVLKPWTQPLADQFPEFKGVGRPDEFLRRFDSNLLCWVDWRLSIFAPGGPPSFGCENSTPLFASDGHAHKEFPNWAKFMDALLYRSTQILFALEPAQTITRTFPAEPVAGNDEFETGPAWPLLTHLELFKTKSFSSLTPAWFSLTLLPFRGACNGREGSAHRVFAGAALADWGSPDGKMFAMIFSPDSRTTGIHTIQLQERHKNAIRQLKIPLPTTPPERKP